jgi:hypothetical protein
MRDLTLIVYIPTSFYDLSHVYLYLQDGSQSSAVRALLICKMRLQGLLKFLIQIINNYSQAKRLFF